MTDHEPVIPWMTMADFEVRNVSYAQNAEDMVLERALPEPSGLYVDIGANDPVFHSVTKRFYDRGWRGINVEPNPGLHRRLQAYRLEDVNLNIGIGEQSGVLTFFEFPTIHGWSTFDAHLAEYHERQLKTVAVRRDVPVRTLADICEEHVGDRPIDFLKIDVENFESQVIRGGDWSRWRPRIVVVELLSHVHWEGFLLDAGYTTALTDGINRYYVRNEEPQLLERLQWPVNCLDMHVPHEYVLLIDGLKRRVDGLNQRIEEMEAEPNHRRFRRRLGVRIRRFAGNHLRWPRGRARSA